VEQRCRGAAGHARSRCLSAALPLTPPTAANRPNHWQPPQFLAFRLAEVKADNAELTGALAATKDARGSAEDSAGALRAQLAALQEAHDRHLMQAEAAARAAAAAAAEEKAAEKAALKDAAERQREEGERRLGEQLATLQRRADELDAENRKLRDAKYGLDSRVSELSHKLGAAEGAARGLEEDLGRLRATHASMASDKHAADICLNEARAKVLALEEKVRGGAAAAAAAAARAAPGRCRCRRRCEHTTGAPC
jgi:spindle assembly abnormal protein 6